MNTILLDNQKPVFQTPKVVYAFRGKVLKVQLRSNDPENRLVLYTFVEKVTVGASLTEDGVFLWTPLSNMSTPFLFKVQDECGAYSVLNTTVVIKDCPCQNGGVCESYDRYFDGSGNFTCSCKAGYSGARCELDINECLFSPCGNGTCQNEKPGFSCSCDPGYTGIYCETELDECLSNPCFLGVSCFDSINGYRCGPCPSGYTGTGENCSRSDGKIDECIRSPEVCNQHAKCLHKNGSYVCQCQLGYSGDGKDCTDDNECATPNVCHSNANCTNTKGSFYCQCITGYSGDGKFNCTDVNECSESPGTCHQHANCTNTQGSYLCQCLTGYAGDGKVYCTDVNECVESPSVCHNNANCTNTEGSYSCQCVKGYTGDGKDNCTDIDECTFSLAVCHQHANCKNKEGSFTCDCEAGYSGDGTNNCSDIDECSTSYICDQHAVCMNTGGSYSCECSRGYTGDGQVNCSDIDECKQFAGVCHHHANCTNTEGSYSCQCKTGYFEDGKSNCTENLPPAFTTPSKVYAILNKSFSIQIEANDPEAQTLKYSLVPNGTIMNARIALTGLLTVQLVSKTGNITVTVEDDLGGQDTLELQIIAVPCPCKHRGECYKDKSSSYPVKPSDYKCKCGPPYSGVLCEFRPDTCEELPCFPGLKCFAANTQDGYQCEKCPEMFEGDGKNCELKSTQEVTLHKSELTLTNQVWNDELADSNSKTYKKLASDIAKEIRKIYKNHADFSYVIIKRIRQGSVIVEFELIFTKEVDDPLKQLKQEVQTGKLGNMTVQMKLPGDKESGDSEILGLDKTIFIVVIIAAALLIVIICVGVYLRVKKARFYRHAKLRKRANQRSQKAGSKPKGLHHQPAADEVDAPDESTAHSSQNMNLKVFDNEAIDVIDQELKSNV